MCTRVPVFYICSTTGPTVPIFCACGPIDLTFPQVIDMERKLVRSYPPIFYVYISRLADAFKVSGPSTVLLPRITMFVLTLPIVKNTMNMYAIELL